MLCNCKNGISSHELARAIGVTQKTAWFMLHRIRLAMQEGGFETMNGEVEVDETFIGGRARFMHKARRERMIKGRGPMGKTAVMGLLERHGEDGTSRVRTHVLDGRRKGHLQPQIRERVAAGASVHTDALMSYDGLGSDYVHNVIEHAECYAKGNVHTNGLKNFWSLLKRAVKGTYVSIEPFHLFRYLDEQSYRFNTRTDSDGGRFLNVLRSIVGKRVTYAELTGAEMAVS